MNRTSIEWVRNPDGTQGYTWNPITGCLNDCYYCYARKLAHGRLKSRMLENLCLPDHVTDYRDPFYPRFWITRLSEPHYRARASEPHYRDYRGRAYPASARGIFVCSMGELFGPWLPEDWTHQVLREIWYCSWHRFYLLTKQPQELTKRSPFPLNAWVGVTAVDHVNFLNTCRQLQGVEAAVKYISIEPLLAWEVGIDIAYFCQAAGVSWLIIGAQTRPLVIPEHEWVEDIVRQAQAAGIAVFIKDSILENVHNFHGVSPLREWPKEKIQ